MHDDSDHTENASSDIAEQGLALSTRKAYAADWRAFASWCAERGSQALPAAMDTVAAFLTHLADQGRSWSGVRRAGHAIVDAHRGHGGHTVDSAHLAVALRDVRDRVEHAETRTLTDQGRDEELADVLAYVHWFFDRTSSAEARAAVYVLARALADHEHRA